jgi:hypothetical protein
MKKFKITLDASYNYDSFEIEAENILHLLSMVSDAYSISRITKIELIKKKGIDYDLIKKLSSYSNYKIPYKKRFKITFNYYECETIEADNMLHLLSKIHDSILDIITIELAKKEYEDNPVTLKELCEGESFIDSFGQPYICLKSLGDDKFLVRLIDLDDDDGYLEHNAVELHECFPVFRKIKS